jgi:excisionase family DNA binding protein
MQAIAPKTWYVYLLCDPDTQVPFYVGKGTGDRAEHHMRYLESDSDPNKAKKDIISQLQSEGKRVLIKKVAEFTLERDAYIYEWALINLCRETITNIRPGNGRVGKFQTPAEKLLSMPYAARLLGISPYELRSVAYRGEIDFRYVGGSMMFSPTNLEKYLTNKEHTGVRKTRPAALSTTSPVRPPQEKRPLVIDDVLDAKEVAKILKVHQRTVIRLAERGELKAFRVGDLWRFRRSDVEEFINKQIEQKPEE